MTSIPENHLVDDYAQVTYLSGERTISSTASQAVEEFLLSTPIGTLPCIPEKWRSYVRYILVPIFEYVDAKNLPLRMPFVTIDSEDMMTLFWAPGTAIVLLLTPFPYLECHPGTIAGKPAMEFYLRHIHGENHEKIAAWLVDREVFDF
jgi:hypothetical protein